MSDHSKKINAVMAWCLAAALCLSGCASTGIRQAGPEASAAPDPSRYLRITSAEPDTVDPQCTGDYYNAPLNVFDRLVEVRVDEDGNSSLAPSLAEAWEISDDGLVYTFHLHEGVRFHNGSALTATDVEYTLKRALTHPKSRMQDIGEFILGGDEFVAILEGSDYADRTALLAAFERQMEENLAQGKITIACGCACFDAALDKSSQTVFERADESMYEQKKKMKAAISA